MTHQNHSTFQLSLLCYLNSFLLILLLLFSPFISASAAVFSRYGTQQGLTDHKVRAIIEDQSGYIWVGTTSALFKFDGQSFKKIDTSEISERIHILSLAIDESKTLLIGTRNHGLLSYHNHHLDKVILPTNKIKSINDFSKYKKQIWIATNSGLLMKSLNQAIDRVTYKALNFLQNKEVTSITTLNQTSIAIASGHSIYIFNHKERSIKTIELPAPVAIHDVHHDSNENLWIATSKKLYRYDWKKNHWLTTPVLDNASRILSIDQYKEHLWIASIDGGLYKVHYKTLESKQYLFQNDSTFSLQENNIMALYITESGMLWAGSFFKGLNGLDLNLEAFDYHTYSKNSIYCAKDTNIYSLKKSSSNAIWLGNSHGLIKWLPQSKQCQLINNILNSNISRFTVYDTQIDDEFIWIASNIGLLKYDSKRGLLKIVEDSLINTTVFFIHKTQNTSLIIGTSGGVYRYHIPQKKITQLNIESEKYKNISYRNYAVDNNGNIFFSTARGLLYLSKELTLRELAILNGQFINKEITNIMINNENHLFVSVKQSGLYHFDHNHQLVHHYFKDRSSINIYEMIQESNTDQMWLSTNKGIILLNLTTHQSMLYANDAGNNYLALTQASYQDENGTIYFAGIGGYINFKSDQITSQPRFYPLKFTDLLLNNIPTRLNKKTNSNFILTQPLEKTKQLNFSHKDKIIGFEFMQLNFNNPNDTKYFYRLGPYSSEWVPVSSIERRLTFNYLKSGTYQLDIKSEFATGEALQTLSFTVNAPPWLSWWAFACYFFLTAFVVFFYLKKKIRNQQKINDYLNHQVQKQTAHIQQQKQTVENLMVRKNEIFSNVSHEFRTPITLILGPINQLLRQEKEASKKDSFEMISRNAQQLLNLVNQMLKLAQINETDTKQKQLIEVSATLNMIVEPFIHLAQTKDIELCIKSFDKIKLSLTEDSLDIIVNNFLSNAVKYTPNGGKISIGTYKCNSNITIFVKDNGPGIHETEQELIFKRFKRLKQNSSSGTGIGLALVKELAILNQATINVESTIGQGSIFSINFPIDLSLQNQFISSQTINPKIFENIDDEIVETKQTVLIIDDNKDMRYYIRQILSEHFQCLLATDGSEGIQKALKYIPDIIVCDVMMPKIDGYNVCRRLRKETITSHIPIMLLTAIDSKSSRINGWRENIDRYMNKPFDAQELVLQLKNIINTRQILLNTVDSSTNKQNSYLSDSDQQFIDKLNEIIAKGYTDHLFNIQKVANSMFISERQLQRKTRALINKSPMDMIREVRLHKSTQMLAKGKQISYVSDVCGFSSISYFSRSFKKHYGMSPRSYQKLKYK